jgi:pimeloyl-ACP methyl ester carboxylesterase
MISITRYLREYARPGTYPVEVRQTAYDRGGEALAASLYQLPGARSRPGWVVLHGLTVTGREHPVLDRFARAFAASGPVVMVPDIPEWRDLRVATSISIPTIRAALHDLAGRGGVDHQRVGILGFSFGATQAIVAAADPGLRSFVRGIAAWGGYRDLHRLFRFGITGEHEIDGVKYQLAPDPYGRWMMGANYLTGIPGYEEYRDVALALRELALETGRRRTYAWDPSYDPDKVRLRATVSAAHREVFDLFAQLSGKAVHDLARAQEVAAGLADAALRAEPLLEPGQALRELQVPTLVAHGRDDRLVPFTESLRLYRDIRPEIQRGLAITGLFAHSGQTDRSHGVWRIPGESVRFLRLLNSILTLL